MSIGDVPPSNALPTMAHANVTGLLCLCVRAVAPVKYRTCHKAPPVAAPPAWRKTRKSRYINSPTFTTSFSGTFLWLCFDRHPNWKKLVQPAMRKPNHTMSARPETSYSSLRLRQMSSRPNCLFFLSFFQKSFKEFKLNWLEFPKYHSHMFKRERSSVSLVVKQSFEMRSVKLRLLIIVLKKRTHLTA